MKAYTNQTETVALAGSFEDVIFENRNKQYGAYYLRKNYSNHLFYAFSITVTCVLLVIFYPIIREYLFPTPPALPSVTFQTPFDPTPIPFEEFVIPPPPPAIEIPDAVRSNNVFAPPLVVPDEETIESSDLLPVFDIVDIPSEDVPAFIRTTVADPATDVFDDTKEGLLVVGENAMFMGGGAEMFRDWVMKNIEYPSYLREIGISGISVIEFSVNSKGELCDIKFLKSLHKKLDIEITALLLSSPKWIPAKNNGTPVKQRMTMPIIFKIE